MHESDAFTPWTDPVSGVRSYVLTRQVAPLQQSFYFTHSGFTDDGRFLWLYTAFPPAGDAREGRTLAVLDTATGTVSHFPETQFSDASPLVDPVTGEVFWTSGLDVWKRSPDPVDAPVLVATFPADTANGRRPVRLATHLTRSTDGRYLSLDAQIGRDWYIGVFSLTTGLAEIWQRADRCFNHAQFSPTDPNLMLLAQDWWHDPATGERSHYADRLWTIRRGQAARPILPDTPSTRRGHEWWDADGRHVWYVDYDRGTERVDLETAQRETVWPGGTCHSHADRHGRWLVGDIGTYSWRTTGCRVAAFDVETGRERDIVSREFMPAPEPDRGRYHVDPHPRFCLNDRYICYTTTVFGRPDVALVPVAELKDAFVDRARPMP